jgi:NAD(P)-dependent dehydrogenase (short-subunit alcohol dehydrogenase family)
MTERGWALVTGAGGRIGRALALAAGEAGYDVIVHHRTSNLGADETVAAIEAMGRHARARAAELTDPEACRALIEAAERPITLLVNSASLFEYDAIETLTPDAWDAVMAVNARAPLLLAQAFAAALPADREGLIVNITDQRVWRLNPRFFSYTMAKAALWAATQTLAQALAPRIRVNAIGPGPTIQSIHQTADDFAAEAAAVPLGHGPAPAEIGHALRYLIDAPSVTGQMIAVDGGQHLAWRTPDAII